MSETIKDKLLFEYSIALADENGESKEVTFKFKRLRSADMVKSDVLAANYRGNLPVNALTYTVGISDMIAYLAIAHVEPKEFDFGSLYDEELTEIYSAVAEWIKTFRKDLSGK